MSGLQSPQLLFADAAVADPAVFRIQQGLSMFSLNALLPILVLTSAMCHFFCNSPVIFCLLFLLLFHVNNHFSVV